MALLNAIILQLEKSGKVLPKNKPHMLIGNYKGFKECHIQPDWLLIWFENDVTKTIDLTRCGTHSDLF